MFSQAFAICLLFVCVCAMCMLQIYYFFSLDFGSVVKHYNIYSMLDSVLSFSIQRLILFVYVFWSAINPFQLDLKTEWCVMYDGDTETSQPCPCDAAGSDVGRR